MNGGLRQRLAELVETSTGGLIDAGTALAGTESFTALGMDSLGLLRLLDALEEEYGVEIDLGADRLALDSLDGIATLLAEPAAGGGA